MRITGKKTIILYAVVVIELIAMFAVYPGGIVRRETMYGSGGNHGYAYTAPLRVGDEYIQSFISSGDRLLSHSFAVRVDGELSDDIVLQYNLCSSNGEILYSECFSKSRLIESGYQRIDLDLRLKRGAEYSYCLSVVSGTGSISLTCTPYPEDFAPGLVGLSENGEPLPFQAFNQFWYDQKLNIKNVIFIWLFLWLIGAALLSLFFKERQYNLLKLIGKFGFQNLIFVMEISICIFLFSRLTGGMGVDYDEAFSWDLVCNNGFAGIFAATAADVHPPLYYLIVKLAFSVFGSSIKVMVWTSIVPAIIGMILSSIYVRKNWGFESAFIFNFIYGFAPFLLHYNLNLRMYSWMNLFVLGVILIAYEIRLEGKRIHFVLLFLFSISAVYTQYFAVLPIAVSYIWIFINLIKLKDKKNIVRFIAVGLMDVISYIPWIFYGMGNMGIGAEDVTGKYEFFLKPSVIFHELFSSNLENGDIMAMILFMFSIILFIVLRKKYSGEEKSFITMALINSIFCWYFSQWLGSLNGHFFAPRYVSFCLIFVWLVFSIVFSRCSLPVYVLFSLWAIELSLSSFLVEKAYEYDTTPLMPQTVSFIEANVDPDAVIVYDYDRSFKIIWQYYLPGHEFVYFNDLDLSDMEGQTFWLINLAGAGISQDDIDKYGLEVEHNPGMGFMGMERFDLWKVTNHI